ncbi:hypothetical protein [Pelagicoccus sp. SDUM812003]|uniref:hypothetical protein n=1 Tax=Pelagicoccus sp. SDUM812003 TaxID=3041267 RepID=UPI00280C62D7|nr:hypothetical protein [Pelagicoccus sp. SDUM812003]MDQ8205827.1 hypothetical protein [Pelagicoccus sp. SDUM812003]
MFGPKDKTQDIINLIWNRDEYYLVAAGKDAPTKNEVKRVADKFGVKLPKDFMVHATGYWGSPYLEVREEFWPRHKAGDVGPFWSFLYGVYVYAFSEEAPEWMQAEIAAKEFKEMGHTVLPLLKVIGDADVYCYDQKGRIVRWSHEEDIFEPYEGGFFDLLEYEFKELDERRIKKKKAEPGSPYNSGQSLRD